MDKRKTVSKKQPQKLELLFYRELHKKLNVTTRFSKWVEQNFGDFIQNEDFTSVTAVTLVNNGATRPIQDYDITIDMLLLFLNCAIRSPIAIPLASL